MARCDTICSREYVEQDCATWPAPERGRWMSAFADFDENDGPVWVRQTQYVRARVFSRYLRCVREAGLPDEISPDGVTAFIRSCEAEERVPRTIDGYVAVLCALATFFYPGEGRRFRWLRLTRARIHAVAELTSKRKNEWIVTADQIYELGLTLIRKARALGPGGGWPGIQLYRDGLILCFGVQVPERRRALASLTVTEVSRPDRVMRFGGERVKTKKAQPRTWSEEVGGLLQEWITQFRAVYKPSHDHLWIAKGGGPASDSAIATAMRKVTLQRLGIPVTPNRLRDAVATLIVTREPEKAPLATQMLAHASEEMDRHYTETADQIVAGREATRLIVAGEDRVRKEVRAVTRSEIALNPVRRRRRGRRCKRG